MSEPLSHTSDAAIANAKRLYDQAATLAKIGAWECDLQTATLAWTDGVYDIFGIPRGAPLRRQATVELYHDESRAQMERLRASLVGRGRGFTLDARICTVSGVDRWMRLTADIIYENGRPNRIFGAKQDITHEKEVWDRLSMLAHSDPLTGLSNRRAFDTLLRDFHRRVTDQISALVVVDIDNFKTINDQFGHAAGDECLRQMSARLEHLFEDAALVARIGGDEFAILLPLPGGHLQLSRTLAAALKLLSHRVEWGHADIDVGASLGAAILRPSHRSDPSRLFAEADAALYMAKSAGRNRFRIFAGVVEDHSALAGLRDGVDREPLRLG